MAQEQSAEVTPKDPFSTLASAIEERPALEVEQGPQTKSSRHVYWLIGGLCALTVGIAEVGILVRSDATHDAPPPPVAVLQTVQSDACATRITALMNGVSAYMAKTGSAPQSLAVLYPNYIGFQPIDPAVNQPYGYEVVSQSVTITCPSGGQAAAPPA